MSPLGVLTVQKCAFLNVPFDSASETVSGTGSGRPALTSQWDGNTLVTKHCGIASLVLSQMRFCVIGS